ncbi:hypothetical protein AVEN_74540-1 [Araneus ventricosus]|uniref:Uncharacterized protein n=1 Tax=Araneus ventricosus TaxID=182803 RepID=A0A4Y2GTX6_ARAVE|nr:hypothetical protein AVEN_74540-1 [Araneus ventricosus]
MVTCLQKCRRNSNCTGLALGPVGNETNEYRRTCHTLWYIDESDCRDDNQCRQLGFQVFHLSRPLTTTTEMASTVSVIEDQSSTMALTTSTTIESSTTTTKFTTSTAEPSTITKESTTTTSEPSTTNMEPSTTTMEPSTTTMESSTTTMESSTTTMEPSTTTSNPSTTTAESTTETTDSTTATTESMTTTTEASTTTTESTTTTAEPSIKTTESSSTTTEPSITTTEITTTTAEPSTTTTESTTTTPEPSGTTTTTEGSECAGGMFDSAAYSKCKDNELELKCGTPLATFVCPNQPRDQHIINGLTADVALFKDSNMKSICKNVFQQSTFELKSKKTPYEPFDGMMGCDTDEIITSIEVCYEKTLKFISVECSKLMYKYKLEDSRDAISNSKQDRKNAVCPEDKTLVTLTLNKEDDGDVDVKIECAKIVTEM